MNTIVLNKTISINNSVKQEASPTIINIKNGFFSNLIEIFSMSNLASQDGLNHEFYTGPNFIFCTVFLLLTLAGIISNLIVTLTYKFCDKKACSMNPSTNLNLNHRISIKNEENLIKRSSFNSKSTTNRRNTTTGGKLLTNSSNENNKNLLVPPKRRVSIANESQYDDNHNSVISENNFDNHMPHNVNKNLHPKSIMSSSKLLNSSAMHKSNNNTFLNESTNNSANPLAHNQSILLSLGTYNLGYNRMKRCSYFILSLGCCDLFICSLSMPLILVFQSGCLDSVFRSSLYSDAWCKLAHFFVQIPIALEIEILLTIAIDRYTSVFHPMNLNVPDKIKLILVAQILTSSVLSLPNLLFYASSSSKPSLDHSVSVAKNDSFTPSSSSYCAVKNEYLVLYSYYQIGLFVLFVANLIIISVCYLRVYKHVYKASKTQRRESMATNSSLLQLPYPSWQGGGSTLSSSYVRNQIINSTFSIGRNSDKSYRLYSKSWLFCCKKLISPKEKYEEKMESLKQQSLADMIESKKRSSFRRKSFDSRLQEKIYSKINKDEYVLDEVDENDGSNEEKKSSSANKMPLFELCGEKYSNEDEAEFADKKSNEKKDLETEILDKFDEKAELKQPNQVGQNNNNNKLTFNHARRTSCPVSVDRHLREALLKTSLKESSKLSGSISSIYNQTVNKKLELIEITNNKPSITEAKPTNIVHPNRSDSIKYLRKNTSGLMSRIRRFSENPHSSILLKQANLSFVTPSSTGFVSPNQNMRTISSSLFELNSNNGTLSHRVSIRKHTSRPLRHSKTARVLGVATLAFALTWSPYWYYVLKTNANTTSRRVVNEPNEFLYVNLSTMGDYLLKRFLKNSFYLNYVLNPIFYSFVNQRFRRNVASLFRKLTKCILNLVCCCLINKKVNSNKKSNFYSSTSKRSRSRLNSTAKSDAHTGNNFKSVFSKNYKYLSTCCSKTKLDTNKSLSINPDTQKINVTVKHIVEDGKTTNHKEADAGLLVVANETSLSKIIKLN